MPLAYRAREATAGAGAFGADPLTRGDGAPDRMSAPKRIGQFLYNAFRGGDLLHRMRGTSAQVYLAIAMHLDEEATAYPGVSRLADLTGLDSRTVERAICRLVQIGAIEVLKAGGGRSRSNLYRLAGRCENPGNHAGESKAKNPGSGAGELKNKNPGGGAGESKRQSEANPGTCAGVSGTREKGNPGSSVHKTPAAASTNPGSSAGGTVVEEKSKEDTPSGEAKPPPLGGDALQLAPLEPKPDAKAARGRLVALWCRGHKAQTGQAYPASGKGRLAGSLARLLGDFGEEATAAAIGRWFGADRRDFGIGLFEARLKGADAELTGRSQTPQRSRPPHYHQIAPIDGIDYDAAAAAKEKPHAPPRR